MSSQPSGQKASRAAVVRRLAWGRASVHERAEEHRVRLAPHLVLDDAEDLARVRMHDLPVDHLNNRSGFTPTVEGLAGSLAGNLEVQNNWQF